MRGDDGFGPVAIPRQKEIGRYSNYPEENMNPSGKRIEEGIPA
jgi:hypothetical protein